VSMVRVSDQLLPKGDLLRRHTEARSCSGCLSDSVGNISSMCEPMTRVGEISRCRFLHQIRAQDKRPHARAYACAIQNRYSHLFDSFWIH
jgi:hypothetical protein